MMANLKVPKINKVKGLTLIELLVAMAISAILIAAIYRTFIRQQKTYTVQEQVVDVQQNVRVAINRMMREIRMAGFGNVSMVLPNFAAKDGPFDNIITPSNNKNYIVGQNDDQITIIGAFEQVSALKTVGMNTVELEGNASAFSSDPSARNKYICIGGLESHTVTGIDGNIVTLDSNLINHYDTSNPNLKIPVFKVKAITYRLRWDNSNPNMPVLTREDKTDGGGTQVVAENIENLQFKYTLEDGSESDLPADPSKIRLVRVTVNARTSMSDPEFKGETGGYRRRTITSNILVRNNLNP
jgi:prepilin-type N-terminal cleavage/methylation domain-containing protein